MLFLHILFPDSVMIIIPFSSLTVSLEYCKVNFDPNRLLCCTEISFLGKWSSVFQYFVILIFQLFGDDIGNAIMKKFYCSFLTWWIGKLYSFTQLFPVKLYSFTALSNSSSNVLFCPLPLRHLILHSAELNHSICAFTSFLYDDVQ